MFANSGPFCSFNLGGLKKVEITSTDTSYSHILNVRVKRDLAVTELGLAFGGGLWLKLGKGGLILESRYNLGLTEIFFAKGDAFRTTGRTWNFSVGYLFGLK